MYLPTHPSTHLSLLTVIVIVLLVSFFFHQGHYKDVVEFQMSSRNACKSFWKIAITTHAFFRYSKLISVKVLCHESGLENNFKVWAIICTCLFTSFVKTITWLAYRLPGLIPIVQRTIRLPWLSCSTSRINKEASFVQCSRNQCVVCFNYIFRQNAGSRPITKSGPRIFSRGSSYRYSGRTQKQIIDGCRTTFRQQPLFQRFVPYAVYSLTEQLELIIRETATGVLAQQFYMYLYQY